MSEGPKTELIEETTEPEHQMSKNVFQEGVNKVTKLPSYNRFWQYI